MLLGAQGDMEVVWRAADGHQALRRAESDPVDVLLLDIQMPGLDGLATTRRLVARRPGPPGKPPAPTRTPEQNASSGSSGVQSPRRRDQPANGSAGAEHVKNEKT